MYNREVLIDNLISNLPVLRLKLKMSQTDLAAKLGVSRQQIVALEGRKRKLTWAMFLSIVLIFKSYEDTRKLLSVFEIYDNKIEEFIKSEDNQ